LLHIALKWSSEQVLTMEEIPMSIRSRLIAATFAALLPMATMADVQAAPDGWHHWQGRQDSDLGFLRGISLTDAQRTQLHQIMKAAWTAIRPLEKQIHALHRQIADQLASTADLNNSDLTSLQQQALQLQGEVAQQRLEAALQVRALLTPAQLAQAAQVHQQLTALGAQMRNLLSPGGGAGSPSGQ
jgi:Spy/CpxP family protein refolding chaperone